METKTEIRKRILEARNRLTDDEIAAKSSAIFQNIIKTPEYIKAQNILLYASFNSEVATRDIFDDAIAHGKRVYFPKPDRFTNDMEFYQVSLLNQLKKGYMGILEPPEKEELRYRFNPDKDTLVIVPGAAFDMSGNRIGYGKGYYDKFLSSRRFLSTIALAFSCQIVEKLPFEAYDVKMDKIVTEEIVYAFVKSDSISPISIFI